jgi:hypothetical protein
MSGNVAERPNAGRHVVKVQRVSESLPIRCHIQGGPESLLGDQTMANRRIIVVKDDPIIAMVLTDGLKRLHYEVCAMVSTRSTRADLYQTQYRSGALGRSAGNWRPSHRGRHN